MIKRHKTTLERQIWEAIFIENENCEVTMNSKAEWGRNKIPRLINDPEETKYTDKNSQDQLKLGKKRYPEGFTKTHTESPSQEIEPKRNPGI